MSNNPYNEQLAGLQSTDRPEATRGISSLDTIGNTENLASSLGLSGSSNPNIGALGDASIPPRHPQHGLSDNFAPHSSSPLAHSQPIVDSTATRESHVGVASAPIGSAGNLPSDASSRLGSAAINPTSTYQSSSLNNSAGLGSSSQTSGSSFTSGSSGLTSGSSGLNFPSSSQTSGGALPSTSSSTSTSASSGIDIGGAQTSSTGLSTPGGVVKSQDHVENLVSGIGGIILTAPVAAYEIVAGKTKQQADQVRELANQQGLGGVGAQVQGHLSNAAGLAQDKVNQLNASRGADAPPISETITAYATSAAQQAQALAAQAVHSAQGLAGRAHANAPSTGEIKSTASDATSRAAGATQNATSGIGATVSSYAHSAADAASHFAHSAAVQAQTIGAKVGLTSPPTSAGVVSTPSTTTSSSTAGLSTDDTVSGRYDLSQGEIPSETVTNKNSYSSSTTAASNPNTGPLDVADGSRNPFTGTSTVTSDNLPSFNKSAQSGATSGSSAFASSQPAYEAISQPGSASYGQGKTGSDFNSDRVAQ